ncbi:hypothetical protein Tdes44962_MAKER06092 [Teratosphaeria destructans]|uniref:Uncharacterized protein n=1 Tax=Teratosphaeria destructans TaxID=418781 RepID=A0A9W7SI90_9PEZI|nr:hypothetical protein Tdes44962_MAKER06092 [Teratosphaeria destructans]
MTERECVSKAVEMRQARVGCQPGRGVSSASAVESTGDGPSVASGGPARGSSIGSSGGSSGPESSGGSFGRSPSTGNAGDRPSGNGSSGNGFSGSGPSGDDSCRHHAPGDTPARILSGPCSSSDTTSSVHESAVQTANIIDHHQPMIIDPPAFQSVVHHSTFPSRAQSPPTSTDLHPILTSLAVAVAKLNGSRDFHTALDWILHDPFASDELAQGLAAVGTAKAKEAELEMLREHVRATSGLQPEQVRNVEAMVSAMHEAAEVKEQNIRSLSGALESAQSQARQTREEMAVLRSTLEMGQQEWEGLQTLGERRAKELDVLSSAASAARAEAKELRERCVVGSKMVEQLQSQIQDLTLQLSDKTKVVEALERSLVKQREGSWERRVEGEEKKDGASSSESAQKVDSGLHASRWAPWATQQTHASPATAQQTYAASPSTALPPPNTAVSKTHDFHHGGHQSRQQFADTAPSPTSAPRQQSTTSVSRGLPPSAPTRQHSNTPLSTSPSSPSRRDVSATITSPSLPSSPLLPGIARHNSASQAPSHYGRNEKDDDTGATASTPTARFAAFPASQTPTTADALPRHARQDSAVSMFARHNGGECTMEDVLTSPRQPAAPWLQLLDLDDESDEDQDAVVGGASGGGGVVPGAAVAAAELFEEPPDQW